MLSFVVFPSLSWAVTLKLLAPGSRAIPETDQLVVPEAVPDAPVVALIQATERMVPSLSEAVPARSTLGEAVVWVPPGLGEVIGGFLILGGIYLASQEGRQRA